MSEYILVPVEEASEYAFKEAVYYSAPCFILKSEKSRFIIAGYASVDVVDKDNERITPEALKEAFEKMMKRKSRRNLMLHHQNIQIGEILPKYVDKNGKVWKSGVDDKGLFIVAEVFDDTITGREVIEKMKKGELMSFSIGGRVLPGGREVKCDGDKCWTEIVKLELYEVTSCEQGKNPKAKAFILEKEHNADEDWDDNLGETFINASILKENRSKMEEDGEIIEKAEVTALIEEVKKLTSKLNDVIVRAEQEKKLEKEIDDFAEILDVVDKESYRSFMKNCMKSGKSMKECALEWKKKNKAEPEEEDEEEEDETEKAKKKKKKKPEEYYYYYKYPKKEDFESEDEYKKALEEFNKLKAEIIKELGLENAEEVIKKSVQPKSNKFEEVNLDEIRKKADEAMDFKELMYLVGE